MILLMTMMTMTMTMTMIIILARLDLFYSVSECVSLAVLQARRALLSFLVSEAFTEHISLNAMMMVEIIDAYSSLPESGEHVLPDPWRSHVVLSMKWVLSRSTHWP